MDYHMLNTRIAKQCGVNASLILVNLKFWIEKNQANKKHFHDGRYWTYCSAEAMCKVFDYLSPKQIRTAINKLEQSGYIVKGNYNKSAYDRTLWYALTDEGYALFVSDNKDASIFPNGKIENTMRENQNDSEGGPIPDNITDIVPDIIPPNPPEGGTGDAPGESAPVPDKPTRKRERNPALSPDLTPEEEAALLPFSPGLADAARDWLRYHVEIKKPYTETGRRRLIAGIAREAQTHGADAVCALIDHAMRSRYQGIPWDKLSQPPYGGPGGGRNDEEETRRAFEMLHAAFDGRRGP